MGLHRKREALPRRVYTLNGQKVREQTGALGDKGNDVPVITEHISGTAAITIQMS